MLVQPLGEFVTIGEAIANEVVDRQYAQDPSLKQRYGDAGRTKCFQDSCFHVGYLLEAAQQQRPEIFVSYTGWVKKVLDRYNVTDSDISDHFNIMRDVIDDQLEGDLHDHALKALDSAIAQLPNFSLSDTSYILKTNPLHDLAQSYLSALMGRHRQNALSLIQTALDEGVSIKDIYLHVFQATQREVGRMWQIGQISVAQEHYCTAATQFVMSQFYTHVFSSDRVGKTFVAACVSDELHEIGIRMVTDFMEMEGWDTIYLGANLPISEVINAVVESNADALGLSATLPFHVSRVKDIVTILRADPRLDDVRVIVGGYAFGEGGGDWKASGADAYAPDAAEAVRVLTDGAQS